MGGRGTFAFGRNAKYVYQADKTFTPDGKWMGVKILKGIKGTGKHSLPEEAHSSFAYMKLKKDGMFHEMRFYDKDHYCTFEIAFHPEPSLDKSGRCVLHYHKYDRNFKRTGAIRIRGAMRRHFLKYLKGIQL